MQSTDITMAYHIVDTHVHIWDLDKAAYPWLTNDTSIINRTYAIEELEPQRIAAGVMEGILVQAAGNIEDTGWMLSTAKKTDWIKGVVAWLPLMDTTATQIILEGQYSRENYIKGIRHQIHDEPNDQWLLQPAVIDSLKLLAAKNIPFDVVAVKPAHIETALKVAEKVPALKMVFDHLAQPPIAKQSTFGNWGVLMKAAASHPNFYAKISGLGTASGNWSNWAAADLQPYIEFVIKQFGEDRCFCGGDWPVSVLAGNYTQVWDAYKKCIASCTDENGCKKILYSNAKQFYNL
jgi:L-fuconolactonase